MQKLTSKKTIRKYDKDGKLLEEVVEETYTEEPKSCNYCPWYPTLTNTVISDSVQVAPLTSVGLSGYYATTSLNA